MNLINHIRRQRDWSYKTFGEPNNNAAGIVAHIRKELKEIEENPSDLMEWVDVIILALDGACRQGYTPTEIAYAIEEKQRINECRQWPDWRTIKPGEPIEHVRSKCTHRRTTLRCYICEPPKRFLVDPPGGWQNGTRREFDKENEARAYLHKCPPRTRFMDRAPVHQMVNLASDTHPALGEGDEA